MLDQFVWGHVNRISPEAPVPGSRLSVRARNGDGLIVKDGAAQ
jgi:bifunctional ADP-heptose synthase (sugar kinase/adenylyltransferase)